MKQPNITAVTATEDKISITWASGKTDRVALANLIADLAGLIPFPDRCDIRREAADSTNVRQGEATTCRIDMEME